MTNVIGNVGVLRLREKTECLRIPKKPRGINAALLVHEESEEDIRALLP